MAIFDDDDNNVKAKVGGGCFCVVLIASAIMLGCSFGVLDPTQIALDYDTVLSPAETHASCFPRRRACGLCGAPPRCFAAAAGERVSARSGMLLPATPPTAC